MLADANFWVLVSFLGFIGVVVYFRVPGMVAAALDKRADGIARELEEARVKREEAQQALAESQRRREGAEKEAEEILAQARDEAERFAAETRRALDERMERRVQLAEEKIARAESQAAEEIHRLAAEAAVEAARRVITAHLEKDSSQAEAQVTAGLTRVGDSLKDQDFSHRSTG